MTKWLLLAVVLALAFWWISRQRQAGRGRDTRGRKDPTGAAHPGGPAGAQVPLPPEPMQACSHCGVLLPRADAVMDETSGRAYCSPEHRQMGPRA